MLRAALFLLITASPALAQRAPEIVIPGKRGVPVIINGVDASWGEVIGDFGLDRPGLMTPVVVYQPLVVSLPDAVPAYHPRDGKKPGYGRVEVNPPANRPLPAPAPTYFRSWSAGSTPGPTTTYPPYAPPYVEVNPQIGPRNNWPIPPTPPGPKGGSPRGP